MTSTWQNGSEKRANAFIASPWSAEVKCPANFPFLSLPVLFILLHDETPIIDHATYEHGVRNREPRRNKMQRFSRYCTRGEDDQRTIVRKTVVAC